MKELYHSLSAVYEAMYRSFINYEEEFLFYSSILKGYQSKSVIEIGCGTGNLADSFFKNGFTYTGLDVSEDMLNIARGKYPNLSFLQGDMRQFTLDQKKDSCIITGRTISYLLSNEDVLKTFHSINRSLEMGGIVVFDFIDALQFIPRIKDGEEIIHTAAYQQKIYQRKSIWTLNLKEGFTFNWLSHYSQITENGQFIELGTDDSDLRTFTKEELFIFLALSGFEVLHCLQRDSYAFDTMVVTAKKTASFKS